MDAIAERAGVGKPTLYRRFGDRARLVRAVFGARERELQDGMLRGPPPLGPRGAARGPDRRVPRRLSRAGGRVPPGPARGRGGGSRRAAAHGRVRRPPAAPVPPSGPGRSPRGEGTYLADALLATTAADLYEAQRRRGLTPAAIRAQAALLARRVLRDVR
jgi:AcrR family transcriptional regulator